MVTTGPGRISTTSPTMPKSASLARSFSAVTRNASLSSARALLLVALEHVERRQREALAAAHELELVCSFFFAVGLGGALGSTMSGARVGLGTSAEASASAASAAGTMAAAALAATAGAAVTAGRGGVTISGCRSPFLRRRGASEGGAAASPSSRVHAGSALGGSGAAPESFVRSSALLSDSRARRTASSATSSASRASASAWLSSSSSASSWARNAADSSFEAARDSTLAAQDFFCAAHSATSAPRVLLAASPSTWPSATTARSSANWVATSIAANATAETTMTVPSTSKRSTSQTETATPSAPPGGLRGCRPGVPRPSWTSTQVATSSTTAARTCGQRRFSRLPTSRTPET